MDHEDSAVTDVGNEEETHSEPVKVSPADEEESLKDEDVISQPKSLETATALKTSGNLKFGAEDFAAALEDYTAAIEVCPDEPEHGQFKAILLSNRAATYLKLNVKENFEAGIADCTAALALHEGNHKALVRRGMLHERLENYDEAIADFTAYAEKERPTAMIKEALERLPKMRDEKNEKMKGEMMDKLKDLGNLVLKPFGLSTDNFKMEPQASGGYSMKFEPTKKK